jgi:hypothetical protein
MQPARQETLATVTRHASYDEMAYGDDLPEEDVILGGEHAHRPRSVTDVQPVCYEELAHGEDRSEEDQILEEERADKPKVGFPYPGHQ